MSPAGNAWSKRGRGARATRVEDVPFDWDHLSQTDRATLKTFAAAMANDNLDAYRATRNAVHFWRAWLILRRSGIGVTEPMLKKVDTIARRLCDARGQREIAAAAEMTQAKGGGRGLAQADAYVDRLAVIAEVWRRACKVSGVAPQPGTRPRVPNVVMSEVAERNRIAVSALKMQWSRWWSEAVADDRTAVYDKLTAALKPPKR